MNWLDVVLLILFLVSVVASFRKGFSRELIGLITVVVALVCGLWFYGTAGAFFSSYVSSQELAHLCGFFLVFVGVLIAGAIVGYLFGRLVQAAGLTAFDRMLGAGFGAVRGLLLAVVLILAIVAFTPGDGPPNAVVHSRFAPYVIDTAHLLASIAPREVKDGFRKRYDRVKSAWEDSLKKSVLRLPGLKPESI